MVIILSVVSCGIKVIKLIIIILQIILKIISEYIIMKTRVLFYRLNAITLPLKMSSSTGGQTSPPPYSWRPLAAGKLNNQLLLKKMRTKRKKMWIALKGRLTFRWMPAVGILRDFLRKDPASRIRTQFWWDRPLTRGLFHDRRICCLDTLLSVVRQISCSVDTQLLHAVDTNWWMRRVFPDNLMRCLLISDCSRVWRMTFAVVCWDQESWVLACLLDGNQPRWIRWSVLVGRLWIPRVSERIHWICAYLDTWIRVCLDTWSTFLKFFEDTYKATLTLLGELVGHSWGRSSSGWPPPWNGWVHRFGPIVTVLDCWYKTRSIHLCKKSSQDRPESWLSL